MKGITEVIAVILLLLITISMVGFAFVWFSRVSSSAGQQIENQTLTTIGAGAKRLSIDGLFPASPPVTRVYLRNTGSATVSGSEITIYVNSVLVGSGATGCTIAIGSIAPSAVAQCDFTGGANCSSGQTVKVTAPGGQDIRNC